MSDSVRMHTIHGLTEPKKISEREYAIVPGTEKVILSGAIGVSRSCIFKELGVQGCVMDHPVKWPFDYFETDNGFVKANVVAAVALTYLTLEQRDTIRRELPPGTHYSDKEIITPFVEKYKVHRYAIYYIARSSEDKLEVLEALPDLANEKGAFHKISAASVDDYKTILEEAYRPPSRGGNTKALHKHKMLIDEEWYSFFALGAKKFVFKKDTVEFNYIITEKGYRNVIKNTIATNDAKGNLISRGNRGFKKQLRIGS